MNYSPGIYENLPYEEYAAIPAYRSHDLTSVIKCPYTWKYQKDLEPSPALLEGRVQHTVFLEHHKFAEEFVIQPNIDRRTKAGKLSTKTSRLVLAIALLSLKTCMILVWNVVVSSLTTYPKKLTKLNVP